MKRLSDDSRRVVQDVPEDALDLVELGPGGDERWGGLDDDISAVSGLGSSTRRSVWFGLHFASRCPWRAAATALSIELRPRSRAARSA